MIIREKVCKILWHFFHFFWPQGKWKWLRRVNSMLHGDTSNVVMMTHPNIVMVTHPNVVMVTHPNVVMVTQPMLSWWHIQMLSWWHIQCCRGDISNVVMVTHPNVVMVTHHNHLLTMNHILSSLTLVAQKWRDGINSCAKKVFGWSAGCSHSRRGLVFSDLNYQWPQDRLVWLPCLWRQPATR